MRRCSSEVQPTHVKSTPADHTRATLGQACLNPHRRDLTRAHFRQPSSGRTTLSVLEWSATKCAQAKRARSPLAGARLVRSYPSTLGQTTLRDVRAEYTWLDHTRAHSRGRRPAKICVIMLEHPPLKCGSSSLGAMVLKRHLRERARTDGAQGCLSRLWICSSALSLHPAGHARARLS